MYKTIKEGNIGFVRSNPNGRKKSMKEFTEKQRYESEVHAVAIDVYHEDGITWEEACKLAEHIAGKYGKSKDEVENAIEFEAFMIEENKFRYLD